MIVLVLASLVPWLVVEYSIALVLASLAPLLVLASMIVLVLESLVPLSSLVVSTQLVAVFCTSLVLGYVAEWKFYGIWFGFCGGFLIWCLLSALYWACTNWFDEMLTMKQGYDMLEQKQKTDR